MAGLSAAYELANRGQRVILLDRGPISGGITSRTTAHLAPVCDDGSSSLIKLRGLRLATLFQESQEAAVDRIEPRRLAAFMSMCFGMFMAFLDIHIVSSSLS